MAYTERILSSNITSPIYFRIWQDILKWIFIAQIFPVTNLPPLILFFTFFSPKWFNIVTQYSHHKTVSSGHKTCRLVPWNHICTLPLTISESPLCQIFPDHPLLQDYCRELSRKPRLNKTWSNFKAHFAPAFKETQRSSRTLKTKLYAANVHDAQANAAIFAKMHQDHTLALANHETATQANRKSVVLLTKTVSELSSQVAHLTAKLATAQAENAWLDKLVHRSTPAKHGNQASRNSTPSDPNH